MSVVQKSTASTLVVNSPRDSSRSTSDDPRNDPLYVVSMRVCSPTIELSRTSHIPNPATNSSICAALDVLLPRAWSGSP